MLALAAALLMTTCCAGAPEEGQKAPDYIMEGFDGENTGRRWEENLFFSRMEEKTGISFEFREFTGASAWEERKRGLAEKQNLPDVLFKASLTAGEVRDLYEAGVLIDLKPYLEQYAPDALKELETRLDTGYFEDLIRTCLLETDHSVTIILTPSPELGAGKARQEQERLAEKTARWTDEDRALLAVWGHSLQEENGTVDPFFPDPADGTVELSGDGFTVLFAGDRLVAFLGRRTIARRLNSFDLVILDKLRHVTPSPDADEPRAESAEGAEP
jgi:hypothetical protein